MAKCNDHLSSGSRTVIFKSLIDPKILKPSKYDVAVLLKSYHYHTSAGGLGLGKDRYCSYQFEKQLNIAINYLRLSTQGDPFAEPNPLESPRQWSTPHFNFTILGNRKFKDISEKSIEPSFVVSSNIKHPVDVLYNLFRRFLNVPITKIKYKLDSQLRYKIYVPILNEYGEIDSIAEEVKQYNSLSELKTLVNLDVGTGYLKVNNPGLFPNGDLNIPEVQNIELSLSYTVTQEKLSDVISIISLASRCITYWDQKGKINIIFDGGYRLDDTYVIHDLEEILINKDAIDFNSPDFTKLPMKVEISFPLAFYNFSYTKYYIEVPEIIKYFNLYTDMPLDIIMSYDYYTRGISNKQLSVTIPIAPDLPLWLMYGTLTELYNEINNKYQGLEDFRSKNIAYRYSTLYWIYILKIVWEQIYKNLFTNTLKLKLNAAGLMLSPGDIIKIVDKSYEFINGRYIVVGVKQESDTVVNVTLRGYKEEIYKPRIEFFKGNKFPLFTGDINNIW